MGTIYWALGAVNCLHVILNQIARYERVEGFDCTLTGEEKAGGKVYMDYRTLLRHYTWSVR
jgi:hypothetical protein